MAGITQNNQKLQTSYDRDNTKQPEMPYFHYGPSRSEKFNSIRIKGRVFNIKKNKKKKKKNSSGINNNKNNDKNNNNDNGGINNNVKI